MTKEPFYLARHQPQTAWKHDSRVQVDRPQGDQCNDRVDQFSSPLGWAGIVKDVWCVLIEADGVGNKTKITQPTLHNAPVLFGFAGG